MIIPVLMEYAAILEILSYLCSHLCPFKLAWQSRRIMLTFSTFKYETAPSLWWSHPTSLSIVRLHPIDLFHSFFSALLGWPSSLQVLLPRWRLPVCGNALWSAFPRRGLIRTDVEVCRLQAELWQSRDTGSKKKSWKKGHLLIDDVLRTSTYQTKLALAPIKENKIARTWI